MAELRTPKQKISALVITYNEMGYIEKCIDSVSFADEILVVDSYSTDGTYEYLLNHPKVKVIQNPFLDQASDFVVEVDEARLEGCESFVIVPALHSFLMKNTVWSTQCK